MTQQQIKNIGKRISVERRKQHLTQQQLAEGIGVSPVYIGRVERGKRIPSLDTFMNIVLALKTTADRILCDTVDYGYHILLSEYEKRISALPSEHRKRILRLLDAQIKEFEQNP